MRKSIGVLRAIMIICYFIALGYIGKYELDLILCRGVMVNIVIMTVCGIVSDILERRI